jgi:hypothetical protein
MIGGYMPPGEDEDVGFSNSDLTKDHSAGPDAPPFAALTKHAKVNQVDIDDEGAFGYQNLAGESHDSSAAQETPFGGGEMQK